MHFTFSELAPIDRYKLLSSTITPRPIAWVSTRSPDGILNAAPFSFFNVFGEDPPIVGVSVNDRSPGDRKDTGRNIRARPEFVVNLVSEETLDQMNITAAEFAPDVDEFEAAGLTPAPSLSISSPRIAESPVSMECTLFEIVPLGPFRSLVLGEVKIIHIRDDLVSDATRFHVDTQKIHLIGRAQGNSYIRTREAFVLNRVEAESFAKNSA
jgi:flavin reductase (DIM6/NTAB) family NADH-FMN oxidoreductase RutF